MREGTDQQIREFLLVDTSVYARSDMAPAHPTEPLILSRVVNCRFIERRNGQRVCWSKKRATATRAETRKTAEERLVCPSCESATQWSNNETTPQGTYFSLTTIPYLYFIHSFYYFHPISRDKFHSGRHALLLLRSRAGCIATRGPELQACVCV